jgi:hypothetical protein
MFITASSNRHVPHTRRRDLDAKTLRAIHTGFDNARRAGAPVADEDFQKLLAAGAWTDAALLLLERMLPAWRVRRIVYDETAWHCALSKTWWRPDWLDESAEHAHRELSVAILGALLEAHRQESAEPPPRQSAVPTPTSEGRALFCENIS